MGKPTLLVAGKLKGEAARVAPDAVPIDYIIDLIQKKMPEFGGGAPTSLADRVFIVRSETGSGKSTVLPAQIFRLLRSEKTAAAVKLGSAGVICTQPRILTAQTIPRDLAADGENYPDLVMGVTIGYQTGPMNEKPLNGLIYGTAGSLLAQLRLLPDADIMSRYRFIIVDEAHERSLDIDSLLMRLKIFLKRNLENPRLPFVLLASATLPVKKYAQFFDVPPKNIVEVTGRAHEVLTHWPTAGTNDYPKEAARVALQIHERHADDSPDQADILIFMPGKPEIRAVVELLIRANDKYRSEGSEILPFFLLMIDREVIQSNGRDYRLIKEDPAKLAVPSRDGSKYLKVARRIVVSTVVAETGITIETLKYVIDCGWSREKEVYYPERLEGVLTRPAPQSRIEQRKGRAGRKFPGMFFPLYTKNVFEQLPTEQLPEIILKGVSEIFLDIVAAASGPDGLFRVENIDMLDPPPVDALAAALEEAVTFGFLRFTEDPAAGHALTRLGEIAARFTYLTMHHVETLLAGFLWRVSMRDLALIVALFSLRNVPLFHQPPPGPSQVADAEKAKRLAIRSGLPEHLAGKGTPGSDEAQDAVARARAMMSDDFIEGLVAFEGFVRALDRSQGDLMMLLDWCEENGIDFDGAANLALVRDQVIDEMIAAGLNPFWGEEYRLVDATPESFAGIIVRLKQCIYAGLRFHLVQGDKGAHQTTSGLKIDINRASSFAAESRQLVTNAIQFAGSKGDQRDKHPPFLYHLQTTMASVLDGYVDVDSEAMDPRVAEVC